MIKKVSLGLLILALSTSCVSKKIYNDLENKFDIYDFDINITPYILVDKKSMSDNWEKYLELLRKLIIL